MRRSEGEKGGMGAFVLEDNNGIEWEVEIVAPRLPNKRGVTFRWPQCLSADYETDPHDMWEACKEFFDEGEEQ
jgi:hypothetical protein